MPETLTLTTPVQPTSPSITGYSVWSTYFGRGEGVIRIVVQDNNGQRTHAVYTDGDDVEGNPAPGTTIATDLMKVLNKANLTTKSLQRRILEKLAADGKLPEGTVDGTPD